MPSAVELEARFVPMVRDPTPTLIFKAADPADDNSGLMDAARAPGRVWWMFVLVVFAISLASMALGIVVSRTAF